MYQLLSQRLKMGPIQRFNGAGFVGGNIRQHFSIFSSFLNKQIFPEHLKHRKQYFLCRWYAWKCPKFWLLTLHAFDFHLKSFGFNFVPVFIPIFQILHSQHIFQKAQWPQTNCYTRKYMIYWIVFSSPLWLFLLWSVIDSFNNQK